MTSRVGTMVRNPAMRGGFPNFLAILAPLAHISAIVAARAASGLPYLSNAVSGEVSPEKDTSGFEPAPARYLPLSPDCTC